MTGWPAFATDLARDTLRTPRPGVRRLLSLGVPMEARWLGVLLVSVLAAIVTRVSLLLLPPEGEPGFLALIADPVVGVPAQALSLVVVAAAITGIGRLFGGQGSFADALLVVVWIEFLMTAAQVAELAVLLVLPPVGALLAIAVLGFFLWLVVNAVAELHGFGNLVMVLLGLVGGFVALVVALATLLSALGILTVS